MLNVPKKANDIMHLSLLEGCAVSFYTNFLLKGLAHCQYFQDVDSLGDVLLQESFTVWDPRQIIKKGRDRHVFLFELCLVFCKRVTDQHGKVKYFYKSRLLVRLQFTVSKKGGIRIRFFQTSEINVTEHIEGDECKFALWTGRVPNGESRTVLKVSLGPVISCMVWHLLWLSGAVIGIQDHLGSSIARIDQ